MEENLLHYNLQIFFPNLARVVGNLEKAFHNWVKWKGGWVGQNLISLWMKHWREKSAQELDWSDLTKNQSQRE